jgi:hypothetical protein
MGKDCRWREGNHCYCRLTSPLNVFVLAQVKSVDAPLISHQSVVIVPFDQSYLRSHGSGSGDERRHQKI